MSDRYKVSIVTGYPIREGLSRPHSWQEPGLTASVLDTMWAHRIVASFRSEDNRGGIAGGLRLGVVGALAKADKLCAQLNAETKHG